MYVFDGTLCYAVTDNVEYFTFSNMDMECVDNRIRVNGFEYINLISLLKLDTNTDIHINASNHNK